MSKKKPWFIKVRGSYLPNNLLGWLTYIPYLAYVIGVYVFVLTQHYGFWQSMFTMAPNWIAAIVIMNWVAQHTS